MASLSTARKLSLLARVLAQRAGRNRLVNAVINGGRATAAHFGRILHILWLEVTGFVFLFIAIIGAGTLTREYAKYNTLHSGSGRLVLAIVFTITFAWFGISSFWRAAKKSNRRLSKSRLS